MKTLLSLLIFLPNFIHGMNISEKETPRDSMRYFSFGNRLAYNYFDETTVHFYTMNGLVVDDVNNNLFRYSYLKGQFDTLKEQMWVKTEALAIDSLGEFLFSYGYGSSFMQEDSMYANFYKVTFRVENREVEVFLFSDKDKIGYLNLLKSKPLSFLKFPGVKRSFYLIENRFTLEHEIKNGDGAFDLVELSYLIVEE